MATGQQISLITSLARQMGLDPRAVLAVAAQEGLSGGIGDSGTSFGPFQLHKGGALPRNLANPQAWAWSRAGLLYALNRIKAVVGNATGAEAIRRQVNLFEKPREDLRAGEIAKAIAHYQGGGGPVQTSPGGATPLQAPSPSKSSLLSAIMQGVELPLDVFRPIPLAPPGGSVSPSQPLPAMGRGFTPAELFYRNMALKNGQRVGAVPNHFDHVHAAYTNPAAVLQAIALAKRLGLRVGENPAAGGVHPVHVRNSYHYRRFPNRNLGEAIDVSGNPAAMMRFYQALSRGLK